MAEDDDVVFEPASGEKNKPPLFDNEDHGVTIWADQDKNGNYFLRLRLPLGLGTVPLFVNDAAYEGLQESVNRLIEHHQK
jgi:hypothetical protein